MCESWLSGAGSLLRIFIPRVTQGNEDVGSVQDFILSFWCESRLLGDRASPSFPCVIPVVERFSSELLRAIVSYWAESLVETCQTSTMELPRENNQRY